MGGNGGDGWFKSSYSSAQGNCVEVKYIPDDEKTEDDEQPHP